MSAGSGERDENVDKGDENVDKGDEGESEGVCGFSEIELVSESDSSLDGDYVHKGDEGESEGFCGCENVDKHNALVDSGDSRDSGDSGNSGEGDENVGKGDEGESEGFCRFSEGESEDKQNALVDAIQAASTLFQASEAALRCFRRVDPSLFSN